MMTISQALRDEAITNALDLLTNAETPTAAGEAMRILCEALPWGTDARDFSVHELIVAALEYDGQGRYVWR